MMLRIRNFLLPLLVAGLIAGCGGDSGSDSGDDGGGDNGDDSGGDSGGDGGANTGCISSNVSDGAYFIGSFTGLEAAQQVSAFDVTNSDAGCGGLGFGAGYSIAFQLADPGDPNGGDLNFMINIADDAIPEVAADQPATVLLTLPGSENPARGGFFNGIDCFVTITALPEEPNQEGGRLFYPEGTFTCSSFTLDPTSASTIGPQPDILISPSSSVVEFLGAVAITTL